MDKESLIKLKEKLSKLDEVEEKKRDLYLKKIADGTIQGPIVGYPEIDKVWLRNYTDQAIFTNKFNGNIIDYLKEKNANNLDDVAIEYFTTKYKYKEFFEKVDNIAKSFLEAGVKKGDSVTIALPNIPEYYFAVYGLNSIGAIANIIDLRLKDEKLINNINKSNSKFFVGCDLFINNLLEVKDKTKINKIVVTSPSDSLNLILKGLYSLNNKNRYPKTEGMISWDSFYKLGLNSKINNTYISSKDDIAAILYTSATTGDAKAVTFKNSNFNAMAEQLKNSGFNIKQGDKFLNQVPTFLAFNIFVASHFPFSMGVKMRLLPDYQPDIFYKNIAKYKPNHTIAGPADWGSFVDNYDKAKNKNYSYLKTMVSGSDKFPTERKDIVDELFKNGGSKFKVTEGYGMSEVGAAAVSNLPQINVKNSVGIPMIDVNVCIYDNDNDCELEYNNEGEICFSGPTVMMEYYNDQDTTNEVLKKHKDGKIWMHSGDLGYMNKDGSIFLKGRLKRMIPRYDGIKISPLDIEHAIEHNQYVAKCCVVGVTDKEHSNGEIPVAYIVLKDNIKESDNEIFDSIMNSCKEKLSDNYLPKDFQIIEDLPLTSVGKVDYRSLINDYNNKCLVKR